MQNSYFGNNTIKNNPDWKSGGLLVYLNYSVILLNISFLN